MFPHNVRLKAALSILLTSFALHAQSRKAPSGGYLGIIVDERLSVLRVAPQLDAKFIRRLPRGKLVAIRRAIRIRDGESFLLINVSRRTHGWILSDALVSPQRKNDDEKLISLIKASSDFERVVRAQIFLDYFKNSLHRPEILLLLGETAEQLAAKLSREASKKLDGVESAAYYSNYVGLDRYSRKGVAFVFDSTTKAFRYDGAVWHELLRRYPTSIEALAARQHLAQATRR